ncbi:hypothetical protein FQN54_008134 [Arachnomyces sp. PD_36]|nr:hypothetical protein FQN54_008134 [Arachnomyces sp. PD_36]
MPRRHGEGHSRHGEGGGRRRREERSRHGDPRRGPEREDRAPRASGAEDDRNHGGDHQDDQPREGTNDDGAGEPPPPSYTESTQNQQLIRIEDPSLDADEGSVEEISVDENTPPSMGASIEAVRKFMAKIMTTKCESCGTKLIDNLSTSEWFKRWYNGARRGTGKKMKDRTMICETPCPSCQKRMCIGCGRTPGKGKQDPSEIKEVSIIWCCRQGKMFGTWLMLAHLDLVYLNNRGGPSEQRPGGGARRPGPSRRHGVTGDERGVGYADLSGRDPILDMFSEPVRFKETNSKTDSNTEFACKILLRLLNLGSKMRGPLPPEITGMFRLSLFFDKVAKMFRNDSLDDLVKRYKVYNRVLKLVLRMGTHPHLHHLLTTDRRSIQRTAGLKAISLEKESGQITSLMELSDVKSTAVGEQLKNLAKQSFLVLKGAKSRAFQDEKGKILVHLCEGIVMVYKNIHSKRSRKEADRLSKEEQWVKYHQGFVVTRVDGIIEQHMSHTLMSRAQAMLGSNRGRIKRLVMEGANMSTSLPVGIFVKISESRPDIMKCLIMGPPDSPYGYGLFEFDILCPEQYPHVPPFVKSRTTIGAPQISPNIHPDGKVCLSLLGTWKEGDAAAQWQPGKSTILSVLISIQAMIFNEEPWRNEPAYTSRVGTRAEHACRKFNERIQPLTVHYYILGWLKRSSLREGIWRDVVKHYFYLNERKIVDNVRRWAATNRSITDWRGFRSGMKVDLMKDLVKTLDYHHEAIEKQGGLRRRRGRRSADPAAARIDNGNHPSEPERDHD